MIPAAIIALLQRQCQDAGGYRAWGRLHGVHEAQVRGTCAGDIAPPPAVLRALGLRRVITYERVTA